MKKTQGILPRIVALLCILALTGCGAVSPVLTDPTDAPRSFNPDFTWKVKIHKVDYDTVENQPKILRLSYESCKEYKSVSYPEMFFEDNSLLLIPTSGGGDETFEVTEVSYVDSVLTCILTSYVPGEPIASTGAITHGLAVFIELDTVLPEGTQLKTEWIKSVVDMETYEQRIRDFNNALNVNS